MNPSREAKVTAEYVGNLLRAQLASQWIGMKSRKKFPDVLPLDEVELEKMNKYYALPKSTIHPVRGKNETNNS